MPATPFVFAIDPGTDESGWVLYHAGTHSVNDKGVFANDAMLGVIRKFAADPGITHLAVEMIAGQGMAVGAEVFETCVWVGRFMETWREPNAVIRVYRRDVKLFLCGQSRAKDANVRQAIIDLWPRTGGGKVKQIGVPKQPGPLFGVATHMWPALGVALTAVAQLKDRPQRRRLK